MRSRPKKSTESLSEYADAVVKDFRERAAAMAPSVEAAWGLIFDAMCQEGQHVRVASPAAIVIYQRYFAIAVDFLKDYPDDDKHDELVALVRKDLMSNAEKYQILKADAKRLGARFFTEQETAEGKLAYLRILTTLKSFA